MRSGPASPSITDLLRTLIHDLPAAVSDRVHLLTLELRRAMQALVGIVVLMLCAVVLLLTTWVALWLALAVALLDAGWGAGWVALLVVVLNGGAAAFALWRASRLAGLLTLPATLRRLTLPPPPESAAEPSAAPATDATPMPAQTATPTLTPTSTPMPMPTPSTTTPAGATR